MVNQSLRLVTVVGSVLGAHMRTLSLDTGLGLTEPGWVINPRCLNPTLVQYMFT